MKNLPLRIFCSLVAIFEITNLWYLVREVGIFTALFSGSGIQVWDLGWQFLYRLLILVSIAGIWAMYRWGACLYAASSVVNLIELAAVSYIKYHQLGGYRVLSWAPLAVFCLVVPLYWRSMKKTGFFTGIFCLIRRQHGDSV